MNSISPKEYFYFQRAFTLIELLIAVAIVGILAAVGGPAYSGYADKVKVLQAVADITSIQGKLLSYETANNGKFPPSLTEVGAQDMLDPWGNPYQYLDVSGLDSKGKGKDKDDGGKAKARKDHNLHPINSDFDLYSMGKDGKSVSPLTANPSRDDIVRANNGRFIDLASKY